MPKALTLSELVAERRFRPSRHHRLLAEGAVGWPVLAALQGEYVAATTEAARREVAVRFLRAVRALDAGEHEEEPLTPVELELQRIFALPPVPVSLAGESRAVDRYWRACVAATALEAGVTVRQVADERGLSPTTIRRDARWLATLPRLPQTAAGQGTPASAGDGRSTTTR